MPALRAVIFDLGRVLVGVDVSRGLLRRLTSAQREDADAVMNRLVQERLFSDYCAGRLTPEAFHQAVIAKTGLELEFAEFAALWCDIFHPQPGMAELLAEVAAARPVGLLSDTDPLHWNYLRQTYPWLNLVPRPTLSYEIGAVKPTSEAYLAASASVATPPEACFFVDDLPRNVAGAQAVGMTAWRFTDATALRAELVRLGLLS